MKLLSRKVNNRGNFAFLGEQGVALLVFVVILGTVGLTASMFLNVGGAIARDTGNGSGLCDVTAGGGAGFTCNESFVSVVGGGIDGIELFGDFTELVALTMIASVILGMLIFFRGGRR